jgi:hypothetical protein
MPMLFNCKLISVIGWILRSKTNWQTNIFYPQEQYKIQSGKVLHTEPQVVYKLQLTCAAAEESLHS